MTGLRVELRRSAALWAGLVVLVSGAGMLWLVTSESSRWKANSTSAVLELRLPLAYVWALVVGLAVLQGMRDSRAGVTELFTATPRPGWVRLGALASAVSGAVAVAAVLLCAAVVATVAFGGGLVSAGFVPLVVTVVLGLASSVLVGLAIGRLLPHPLTVPVALVATFMVATTAGRALEVRSPDDEISRFALLTPVMDAPDTDLLTTSAPVDLGQAAWFTGLGVTAFLLLAARTWLGRLAALAPAGLALVLALSIVPARYSDVLVVDSTAGEQVCDGAVCVSRVHADRLPVVAAAGRAALAELAALPDAPTGVREDTSAMAHLTAPRRDSKIVYISASGHPRVLTMSEDEVRLELLAGAGVPSCSAPNSVNYWEAAVRYVTAGYFNGGLAELASERLMWNNERMRAEVDRAWQRFSAASPQEQRDRVVRARQMLLTCQDAERVLEVLKAGR
ncbi:hypothetical protein [Lentzea sp. CC55]|uniref:hypothetical protein n=1 Tax=Lentzea sp. CC55 TaxID=2884909 RepID=UPI001F1824B3|nr:hypothetical protein [Lentzea sp. CC55]MCG8922482.1 hypothetical protein [Lentzea sp. CC55]